MKIKGLSIFRKILSISGKSRIFSEKIEPDPRAVVGSDLFWSSVQKRCDNICAADLHCIFPLSFWPKYSACRTCPALFPGTTSPRRSRRQWFAARERPAGWILFAGGLCRHGQKTVSVGSRMINARSESLSDKPSFRNAVRFRRCIVPASGFYEWKPEGPRKIPYYIRMSDGAPMGFAAIWEAWKTPEGAFLETFAILTTSANPLIAPIHERMPVILHPDTYGLWLDKDVSNPEQLLSLYLPFPAELLTLYPVSTRVNSPRNDDPACIVPASS